MKQTNRSQRPEAPEPDWEAIPEELRNLRQWVLWRYVWKDGENSKGSWTKLPLQPSGEAASSTDSNTWSQFETVRLAYLQQAGRFAGIGFVFTRESGYIGIDLDECITWGEGKDRHIPTYNDWAQRLFERLSAATDGIGTYTEFSPSRTGLHFIVKANPSQAIKLPEIEIYPEGRYFTMTGSTCWADDVQDCTETVNEIVSILLGEREAPHLDEDSTPTEHPEKPKKHNLTVQQRIDLAFHAVNGEEVRQLFGGNIEKYKRGDNEGRSEADMALASYFAFYCDGDPEILSQMMLQSKLVRPKYVRILSKKDGKTYLEKTIELVLSRQKKFYNEGEMIFNFVPHTVTSKSQKRYQLLELGEAAIKDRHDPNAQGLRVGGGYDELDDYYRPRRGLLSIIVGDPGSGKTTLTLNYIYYLAMKHKLRAALTTFENDPIDIAHSLVQAHLRKPTFPELDGACTDQEFLDALDQIGNQFMVYQPSWDESNCQALVENYWEPDIKGDGLDILFLDPFSNLQPPPELLGKYTDFANQQLAYFWRYVQSRAQLGFLCCHPTKNYDRKQGPPKLWNINGSGAFDRCADYGLGIMRQDHRLIVEVQKIRKWRTGSMGETIALTYRQTEGQYQRADLPAKYRQNGFQRKKAGIRF